MMAMVASVQIVIPWEVGGNPTTGSDVPWPTIRQPQPEVTAGNRALRPHWGLAIAGVSTLTKLTWASDPHRGRQEGEKPSFVSRCISFPSSP